MPGGDRTGPMGRGSLTGRRMGSCAGATLPGPGFGRGRGWRHRAYATGMPGWTYTGYEPGWWDTPPTPPDEAALLKHQAEQLQAQLDAIQQRLSELEET